MKQLLLAHKLHRYLDIGIRHLYDLETGVKTITSFIKEVEILSLQHIDAENVDEINKYKGDMLEILAEIFLFIFETDTAVGISNYEPVAINDDYGVDGIGTNVNNDKCVVQVKYRTNPVELITYADIARTYTAGRLSHNVLLEKDDTIFLFTTAAGVTDACQHVLGNKLRVINRKIIASYIDNNMTFWRRAEELIISTLDG